jgi:vitamin B12 transporter
MRTILVLTLLAALPPQSQGQDTTRLRDVVITAAGTPVERRQAPATTTVLEGAMLRDRGIATLADALRDVPGVAVARSGSFGATTSLFVRGGERDYGKVLIDGVPVNEPGGDFDFAHLSIADVERIEIVRGPSSVLFGSDAVSGVVHVITRRGRPGVRASGSARSGSFGSRDGELSLDGGIGATTVSASGTHRETDGILPFNNGYRASTVSGSAGYIAARAGVRLTGRRTAGRFHFPTDGSGMPVDSNQYTDEARDALGLEGTTALGSRTELRLLLSHAGLDRTSANLPDSPGDSADFYFVTDTRSTRRGADLRATFTLVPAARLTIGGAFERQHEISDGTATFGTAPLEPTHFDERRETRAGYAELLASPDERFQLALGGRIDDNSRFGVFRTGRISATAWLASATALRLSMGTAFKEPAFSEVFPTSFSLGDSALRPERTRSWEIGLDHTFADRLTIGARYFDQRFRDLIQFRFVDRSVDLTTPNYANVAAATARGVEVEAALTPWRGLRLSASATRLETEVTEEGFGASGTFVVGEPLLRRADWLASLAASQRLTPALLIGASAHHMGERRDFDFSASDFVVLDPFTTVDVFADYELPLTWSAFSLTATARAENLFVERYQHVFGFDAPGRVFMLGIKFKASD